MALKIIRDPLYNYISIDANSDAWLVELLDCPEVQRLRRIHQLGVSYVTYPGADHNRLAHSLGVLHLMQRAHDHALQVCNEESVRQARPTLLAAALLHDIGHGPFSHLFEPCLGIKHEDWSCAIIRSESTQVNRVLRQKVDPSLPERVAALIDKANPYAVSWQRYLLSSQLDVDRLDYLRRDSLFTGAGYGHFDWYRLLNTFEFHENENGARDIVWTEKAKFSIEEYVFSRYYMYQNVYLHKTTRGLEKMLEAMWKRATSLRKNGEDVDLVGTIAEFWSTDTPSIDQYLALEEFTVLQQIQQWIYHRDSSLADLARRFLYRDQFAMIEAPSSEDGLKSTNTEWEEALHVLVSKAGFEPTDMYVLKDELKPSYKRPYTPERESDEQSATNAIRLKLSGEEQPVEITKVLPRLRPLVSESTPTVRYYVPKEVRLKAKKLRDDLSKRGR